MPKAAQRIPTIAFLERRTPRQVGAAIAVVAVYALVRLAGSGAGTLLDRWWYASVTDAPIWRRRLLAELQLGLGTALIVALVLGGSVWVVLRIARLDHGDRHRFWQRYDDRVGPAHRWLLIGIAAYLTWHIGRAASAQWQMWLLFSSSEHLSQPVPEIGGDLSFYLFRLPFLAEASAFLRQLLLVALALSVFGYAAAGAIRLPNGGRRSHPGAVAHLAVLTTWLVGLQAAHEVVIARAMTAINRVGTFDGPGYTEIYVTRPALWVSAITLLVLGFTVTLGSQRHRWRPAVIAAGVATAVFLVGVVALPAAVERTVVAPAEADRQLWSIDHNLQATRRAYGLDLVDDVTADLVDGLGDAGGPPQVPLFTTAQMARSMQVIAGTPATRVADTDLELVGDELAYVGARAASRADLPERGWVQEHLIYTHGDGVVVGAAADVDADGRPALVDVAANDTPLYYGEGVEDWYVVTGTRRQEYDGRTYEGAGVSIGSWGRRLVLAAATGDAQLVLTTELTDESTLLYRRGLRDRIRALAPFLRIDSDPYPVIVDDEVVWVVDGYTTSSTYPYAQFLAPGSPAGTSLASGSENSVRASVKVTIDAADGETHLYRTDGGTDPIIDAWDRVFPDLLETDDDMPERLRSLLRYPTDRFVVETSLLGRYHVTDPELLFSGADRWTLGAALPTAVADEPTGSAAPADAMVDQQFSATRTFTPGANENPGAARDELAALAIAPHGDDTPATVIVPDGDVILSPQVAQSALDADPDLTQAITLLNANDSTVSFGPMTPLLVDEHLAWVRSITVTGSSPASVPGLYGVAVVAGGRVGLGPTLDDAIADVRAS